MYISAIVIDFGSTNSGCARIDLMDGVQNYNTPIFLHGNQIYAKDDTWFYVRPDLWERIVNSYSDLSDADFRIRSRALPYTEQPNFVWGKQHIRGYANLIEEERWIGFKYFKMNLYRNEHFLVNSTNVSIQHVIRLFLRVLKIECLHFESGRRNRNVTSDEIQWGITIPVIWGDQERRTMTELASEVFGEHVRVLSEPEGPVLSGLVHSVGNGQFSLVKERVSFVVDIGGGTTDMTLLKEVSEDPSCEYPIQVIATTDGIGVGGNNIDDLYWNYILRYLSDGKRSDAGIAYNALDDKSLRELLLEPFVKKIVSYIDMEDAWLRYKHGITNQIQFPPAYLKWLREEGHHEVVDVLTNFIIGTKDIDYDALQESVFNPVFKQLGQKVKEFLQRNIELIPQNAELFLVVKSGGLSLSGHLRDIIDQSVNDLKLQYTSTSIGADSLQVSGNVMDGACVVLLNRKVINRKAPFNIYYDMGMKLDELKTCYKDLGINLTLGQLNEMYEQDIANGSKRGQCALPIAIKGEYMNDHKTPFITRADNTLFNFYGSDQKYIILPYENPMCWSLGNFTFNTNGFSSFSIVIDFNEFPNNNNCHYLIISQESNEVLKEGNICITKSSISK